MNLGERYILAIDQGTTGTTMLLVDHNGNILHRYYRQFRQIYPKPGWVEHDPELIWETVLEGLTQIRNLPWVEWNGIVSIGITNQRETILLWERSTGRPVYPAIVWQCRRTSERCSFLINEGYNPIVQSKTGLRIDPYFSATKLEWMLGNNPETLKLAQKGDLACGTIDSWLIWKLTGGRIHATDYSNACRTMLFNIHELCWDDELLQCFGVPASLLPEVRPSGGYFGDTDSNITGRSIPITGVLGDQQAALFGQGCLDEGMLKNTFGTGCFLLMNTGDKPYPPYKGLLSTVAWFIDGKATYALEGSVFMGGAIIQWLRDELGLLKDAAESEVLAESITDNGGVYLVPAFTGLGAPHWDSYARGLIIGLTRGVNRSYIARAALEGIAYQVGEVIKAMVENANAAPSSLRVDGGAAANNFLLQFQSDICGLSIERNSSLELTGMGAALIAGISSGFWPNSAELSGLVNLERTFSPRMKDEERNRLWRGWHRALERSKGWAQE
jgi:glycerol kinase